jgi:hypothetical protein
MEVKSESKKPETNQDGLDQRKPYFNPRLEYLGDLRSITLGGTVHISGDTGQGHPPNLQWVKVK